MNFDFSDLTGLTIYRLITTKGDLSLRWEGSSNGYYSVAVNVERVTEIPN